MGVRSRGEHRRLGGRGGHRRDVLADVHVLGRRVRAVAAQLPARHLQRAGAPVAGRQGQTGVDQAALRLVLGYLAQRRGLLLLLRGGRPGGPLGGAGLPGPPSSVTTPAVPASARSAELSTAAAAVRSAAGSSAVLIPSAPATSPATTAAARSAVRRPDPPRRRRRSVLRCSLLRCPIAFVSSPRYDGPPTARRGGRTFRHLGERTRPDGITETSFRNSRMSATPPRTTGERVGAAVEPTARRAERTGAERQSDQPGRTSPVHERPRPGRSERPDHCPGRCSPGAPWSPVRGKERWLPFEQLRPLARMGYPGRLIGDRWPMGPRPATDRRWVRDRWSTSEVRKGGAWSRVR